MADIEITVDSGTSKRLLTGGKYCDKNILVTATGGGAEPEPPDDGKTRLYITVPANAMPNLPPPRNQVPLYIQQSVANGVTIDWGDGSATETLPGTGNVNTTHTYEKAGDYVISLDPAEGCELGFGKGSVSFSILGTLSAKERYLKSIINKMVIGNRVPSLTAYTLRQTYSIRDVVVPKEVNSVGANSFSFCHGLEKVQLQEGLTKIEAAAFYECKTLVEITIPKSVKYIGNQAFRFCESLLNINLPDGITSISESTFASCKSLTSIVIPESVMSISDYAFQSCDGMAEIHCLPKSPPELSASKAIEVPDDCVIYVPVGSLESYKTATNWSVYADQMQEEPA